jgi:K+-sensing histidine kinase KdpD
VVIRAAKSAPVCVGNRELLKSLLLSLLDNALEYNETGKIIISTRVRNGNIELAVRDDGPIVDLTHFRKLKQSLGWYNLPISARPLMSGLGIMIAEKFVAAMNGQLTISRHQTGGMTFRAFLPTSRQLSILEL